MFEEDLIKNCLRFLLQGSGCAYYDDLSWYTYERTARTGSNLREVNLDYAASNDEWTYYSSKKQCPFQAGPWTYFQLYIGVELEWGFDTTNVWSMSKHFIDSTPLSTPTQIASPLVRKVKIQQDQKAEYLTLAEIEVYDTSNVNQALNKGATENPPHPDFPATNGIDGSTTTFFSTEKAQGMYSILLWGIGYIMYVHYVNSLLRIQYRRLVDG